jgi:acetyl esterase/lipase
VQSGELEIFRAQNEAFAARAQLYGVPLEHVIEPGMVHVHASFASMTPAAHKALDEIAAFLQAHRSM